MNFPVEIWERICQFLERSDLKTLSGVSKCVCGAAMRQLYRNPHFHPLSKSETWKSFVDRLENGTGFLDYIKYIEELEDVWLFIGAEGEPELVRQDSKLDEKELPKYSLYYFLDMLMIRNQVKQLKLHFHSDLIGQLGWNSCLRTLRTLDLGIKVTDAILEPILNCDESVLEKLVFRRAEITDRTLGRLSHFKHLKSVQIVITPMESRSRYYRMIDSSIRKQITDEGLQHFFSHCKELRRVQIQNLQVSLEPFLYLDPQKVQLLAFTLSQDHGVSLQTISEFCSELKAIKELYIYRSTLLNCSLADLVVNEEDILALPTRVSLSKLSFVGVEISRYEKSNTVYYGPLNSPWEFDRFRQRFTAMYPQIAFEYQHQQ
jgi:hypothetical protein